MKVVLVNNRLCSYTDLYLCNEINGMCIQIIYGSGNNISFMKPPLLGPPLSLPEERTNPEIPGAQPEPVCMSEG